MTKTNRSKVLRRSTAKRAGLSSEASELRLDCEALSVLFTAGLTIRIAFCRTIRRVHKWVHSLNTGLISMQSPRLDSKHCSAEFGPAVSSNESRYKLFISCAKVRQKSARVAYAVATGKEFSTSRMFTSRYGAHIPD